MIPDPPVLIRLVVNLVQPFKGAALNGSHSSSVAFKAEVRALRDSNPYPRASQPFWSQRKDYLQAVGVIPRLTIQGPYLKLEHFDRLSDLSSRVSGGFPRPSQGFTIMSKSKPVGVVPQSASGIDSPDGCAASQAGTESREPILDTLSEVPLFRGASDPVKVVRPGPIEDQPFFYTELYLSLG